MVLGRGLLCYGGGGGGGGGFWVMGSVCCGGGAVVGLGGNGGFALSPGHVGNGRQWWVSFMDFFSHFSFSYGSGLGGFFFFFFFGGGL